ncbi:MAG: MG2 domain-containing protein, partial [Pseudomonadota bacterium]
MITPLKQVALLLAILVAAPSAASAERVLNRLSGTDLPGFDYRTLRNVPLAACERTCLADQQCGAFTYNERARWCFLKSAVGERVPYPGATSAVVETVDTRPALAMPDVSYLPAGYERDAERVLADVANAGPSGSAAGRVSPSQADTLSSNQTPAWLDLVRAMLADQANTYRARQDALRTAAGAAYLALRDARTAQEQGRALAALSLVLERQQVFRPAITASEASVALTGDPGEADRLARLRAQHGFRVLDYTVNADVVRPRLCVQFSEPLRGDGTGLQRFVTLDGEADPPLSVDGKQLCVEGLTHGERYVVVVREGLPATTGETLTTAATFRAYVRDRAPLARFDSNDYVLPRTAQGVPVTTINTDMLDLALYAINDRNLANVVRRGDLKRQLYPYELREIADERGAKVWTGTMAVASERNQSVRTLVPVESLMGTPRPGVYVLTARPVEQAGQSEALATQWFVVSDIGLSTFASAGGVDVFARSLGNSAPMGGVAISLLAANDDVLASALTDDEGYTRLQSRAAIGGGTRPQLVTAQHGEGDFAFVSLSSGAFELTDRGVKGRTAPGPVDAFVAAERGVYRAGETVHATVLVRDDQANALNVPVTMTLTRPDGVVARRLVVRAEAAGGAAVSLPLTTNAATGTWRLSATLDPDAPAVGETTFLVEDFVPQRIAVALSSPSVAATGGARMPVDLKADFLYGAPAAGLLLEGTVALTQTQTIEGFEGYRFGLDDDVATPSRTPLSSLPRTDALGEARLEVPIGTLTGATGPVDATIDVFAREPGGRQVAATLTRPVVDETPLIGIKPRFEGGRVGEGTVAGFDVIALSAERERQALDASWTLTRIERDFQWYRRNGRWFYDAIERTTKVNEGALSIDGAQAAVIETPVGWGRHRLEITANNGRIASSTTFDAGWVSSVSNAETPDVVEIHLDKEAYVAGETAQLRITPRQAGTALVTVLTDKVVFKASVDVPADGAELLIPVEQDWSPGAYVSATLFSHAAAGVGGPPYPSRAIGIAHMRVGTAAKTLNVAIETPEILTPRTTHDVPIRIDGLSPGESAHITVAAVDVGILNLTGYEAPDVDGHYLGQRRLGVDIRDLYGDLIDPNGAARGQPRSGGDGVGAGDALPPTQEPVSLFTGVLTVGADGRVNAPLAIPAFNGTLRVMVIAWSGTKVGDGAIDVTVRDPVVVVGTLPRFLAPGDATRMRFDLHN